MHTSYTYTYKASSFLSFALITALPFFAYGQAPAPAAPQSNPSAVSNNVPMPAGATDCFQYYRFGSVQADVNTNVQTAVSGTPITFMGSLKNSNSYPVIDGSLYVKIFRLKDTSGAKDANGPDVVDQFFVRSGINIPANGSLPIEFTWDIPSYTSTGDYKMATFFTTSKKFNLLGLSFTDDVVGNTVDFRISGEQKNLVSFDKTSATVGGRSYRFAAFAPQESKTAPVPVSVLIRNTTSQNALTSVSWRLYSWDAGLPGNLIGQADTQIAVPAGGSAKASYTVTDAKYPVYLLVGTMGWGNAQSIVNIRFVRQGIDKLRINFPGVTTFPLRAGEETTLFSCLHNSGGSPSVPDGKLVLTLSDLSGEIIHEYTYTGDVTGAMMGIAEKFTPKSTYNIFNLSAKLYQGGTLVDESFLTYDCNHINPSSCLPEDTKSGSFSFFSSFSLSGAMSVLGLLVLFALLFIGMRWVRARESATPLA